MHITTPEEVRQIMTEEGIDFHVENPKYEFDPPTPELLTALRDKARFAAYLKAQDW